MWLFSAFYPPIYGKWNFPGNSYYTDERLEKYLSETENIRIGSWKKDAVNPVLEENLRLTFPDISWVSVRKEGTSLIVALEEMVKYDAASGEKSKPRYICAAKDGQIVSMVTRSGVPRVHVGDTVKKGELLIDGVMEILNDAMEVAESVPVGADGISTPKLRKTIIRPIPFCRKAGITDGHPKKLPFLSENTAFLLEKILTTATTG